MTTTAKDAIEKLKRRVHESTRTQGAVEIDTGGKVIDPEKQRTGEKGTKAKTNIQGD